MSMTDRHIQNWVGSRCDSRRAQSPARDQAERLVVREIYILIAELRKDAGGCVPSERSVYSLQFIASTSTNGPRPRPLCPSSLRYELGQRGLGRGPSGKIAASLGRYANIDLRFYGRRVARGPGDLCGRGHDPTHRPLLRRGPPAAHRQLQHSSRGSGDSALVCCSSYRRAF